MPQQIEMPSWRELYIRMVADLNSNAWRTMSSYSVAGTTISYRSLAEFKEMLTFVQDKADVEDGTPSYRGRTSARARGRWS